MELQCCVLKCGRWKDSNSNILQFYHFPTDEDVVSMWKVRIHNPEIMDLHGESLKPYLICDRHFAPMNKTHGGLRSRSVPTRFLPNFLRSIGSGLLEECFLLPLFANKATDIIPTLKSFSISRVDLSIRCIICLDDDCSLYSMKNSKYKGTTISAILRKINNEFTHNNLPEKICFNCMKGLLQSYIFLQQLASSARIFQKIFTGTPNLICGYANDSTNIDHELGLCELQIDCEDLLNLPEVYKKNTPTNICPLEDDIDNDNYNVNDNDSEDMISAQPQEIEHVNLEGYHETDFDTTLIKPKISRATRNKRRKSNIKPSLQLVENGNNVKAEDNFNTAFITDAIERKCLFAFQMDFNDSGSDFDLDDDVDNLDDFVVAETTVVTKTRAEKTYSCQVCGASFKGFSVYVDHCKDAGHARHKKPRRPREKRPAETATIPRSDRRTVCDLCGKSVKTKCLNFHKKWHNEDFRVKSRLGNSLRNVLNRRLCSICGKTFSYKYYMGFHQFNCKSDTDIGKSELGEKYLCDECPFQTIHPLSLTRHKKRHSQTKDFACNLCDYKAVQKVSVEEHVNRLHRTCECVCIMCGDTFITKYDLIAHQKNIHDFKPRRNVPMQTKQRKANTVPNEGNVKKATNAKERKPKEVKQKQHKPTKRPFQCHLCGRAFQRQYAHILHMQTMHSETDIAHPSSAAPYIDPLPRRNPMNMFECPKCPQVFPNSTNLRQHLLHIHSDMRPFSCAICERAYKTPAALHEHIRIHTGEVLVCDVPTCPATFRSDSRFYSHLRQVHGIYRSRDRMLRRKAAEQWARRDEL